VNPKTTATLLFLAIVALLYFFLPRSEAPEVGRGTSGSKRAANVPPPNVPPVQVPAPKKTSGKKDVGGEKGEPDTNWEGTVKQEFYDSGELKSETAYKGEKKDGIQKLYYKNGVIESELVFVAGEMLSEKQFSESGTLFEVTIRNIKTEITKTTYMNSITGNLIHEETCFCDGENIGPEKYYDESGTLTRQILHDGKGGSKVIYDAAKGIDLR